MVTETNSGESAPKMFCIVEPRERPKLEEFDDLIGDSKRRRFQDSSFFAKPAYEKSIALVRNFSAQLETIASPQLRKQVFEAGSF